ncbi:hypothetical protein [Sphingomonas sp. UV9]|uniref:hypothetical protein n=1 Tax=Sphingomonas sp. UV9 TaxID=1851410 RepID=UPI0013E8AB13|nr:hypothetical protein [Sphingomonas sp. UV9]
MVETYLEALTLLREALAMMESVGDTLIAAHIATPLALLEDRVAARSDTTERDGTA